MVLQPCLLGMCVYDGFLPMWMKEALFSVLSITVWIADIQSPRSLPGARGRDQMAAGAGVALLLLNPSADSQYSCSPGIRNFFSFFGFNFINNLQTIFFFWA